MTRTPDIHLYTTQTPNGIKISITLEELGLPYKVTKIDISKNTQKEPWFLAINPNGRIPALTDTFSDGKTINLFESGGIMQYLVDEYDTEHKISYPRGTREYYEVNNWVCWYNLTQFSHFVNVLYDERMLTSGDSFSSSMPVLDLCKDKQTTSTATHQRRSSTVWTVTRMRRAVSTAFLTSSLRTPHLDTSSVTAARLPTLRTGDGLPQLVSPSSSLVDQLSQLSALCRSLK